MIVMAGLAGHDGRLMAGNGLGQPWPTLKFMAMAGHGQTWPSWLALAGQCHARVCGGECGCGGCKATLHAMVGGGGFAPKLAMPSHHGQP